MALASGTHVGPYEITGAIGAGGMGEVYRAHDAKLGRDVAIKVLPEAFARDAERMARFQREAKVLASLSHPNIATIYGLEDSGSTRALVMELVEGPTLADRIKARPIPIDEAVRIAKQIADALEYAHERGIIHRDLKPANVKVTNDDAVKVLDFGLAKALEGDPSSIDISTSPTISRMATMQGVLLGTAAYMSPEQASSDEQLMFKSDSGGITVPLSWAGDGRFLLLGQTGTGGLVLPLDANGRAAGKPFLFAQKGVGIDLRFSPGPQGHPLWIAYSSNESGRYEIYVRPFDPNSPTGTPPGGGKWQVSTQGGLSPRWNGNGKELFYVTPDGTVMSVRLAPEPCFNPGYPNLCSRPKDSVRFWT